MRQAVRCNSARCYSFVTDSVPVPPHCHVLSRTVFHGLEARAV